MTKIAFVDLKRGYRQVKSQALKNIKSLLERQDFIFGEEVTKFEKDFAKYLGVKHCIGVNSGSDALYFIVRALGIGQGDEVIVPSHTFPSTIDAIILNGARPILADIDADTYNINPEKIEKKINKRTKAILPVHLYGQPCEMTKIMKLASRYKLKVIEDACQAHGAAYKRKRVGSIGTAGAFSFYPAKNLGCFGDGGVVSTNNDEVNKKIRMLRDFGRPDKYHHQFIGKNSRLDTLQAAVLNAKLKYLNQWNQKRRSFAALYTKLLRGASGIILPKEIPGVYAVYHQYVIRTKKRDQLRDYLKKFDIPTIIYYPIPTHLHQAYQSLGYKKGGLPVTEKSAQEILSLPMHPWLKVSEIKKICQLIKKWTQLVY